MPWAGSLQTQHACSRWLRRQEPAQSARKGPVDPDGVKPAGDQAVSPFARIAFESLAYDDYLLTGRLQIATGRLSDLAHAFDRARDLAGDIAHTIRANAHNNDAQALVRNAVDASDRAIATTSDLDAVLNNAIRLIGARRLIGASDDLDRDLARSLVRDLTGDLARDLFRVRDLARDLARDFTSAYELASGLSDGPFDFLSINHNLAHALKMTFFFATEDARKLLGSLAKFPVDVSGADMSWMTMWDEALVGVVWDTETTWA